MTITKAAGALIGSLLIFMLAQWAASGLFATGGHGEAAYVIEVEGDAAEAEAPELSFAEVFAAADPGKGESVFKKCAACHKLEPGANATGPTLYGVVGRPVASVEGFGYSDAMAAHGGEWTPEHLSEFLTKPSALVEGTSMSFAGLGKIEDRVNLIAYLNQHSDAPYVMEAAATEEAAPAEAANTEAAATEAAPAEGTTEAAPAQAAATETAPAEAAPAEGATEAAPAEAAPAEAAPAATETPAAETGTTDAASAPAGTEAGADAGAAMAAADLEEGAKVFKKCAACHKINGENGIGPHLDGVVGRPVASVEGFSYSDALKGLGGDWTPDRLAEFLAKPRDYAPGTSMSFAGLRKEEEIANLIGYLGSIQN